MYKYEIHLHTKHCSACARSTSEEMIDAALEKGYAGIVITNHFFKGNTCIDRNLPWQEFIEEYAKDYRNAKEYGKTKGIEVFFGVEEGLGAGKEMLIYGISPETFAAHPEFAKMSAEEKSKFVRKNGGLCVCAHPFRSRAYIPDSNAVPDPELFDGIEGFNYFNDPTENLKAFLYAKNHNKFIISGGDIHHADNFGNAGVAFNKPIKNYTDFLRRLKKGDFRLINPYFND